MAYRVAGDDQADTVDRMTLYQQVWAEHRAARAALDRIHQPLDYAVRRVSLPHPGRPGVGVRLARAIAGAVRTGRRA